MINRNLTKRIVFVLVILLNLPLCTYAQSDAQNDTTESFTLQQCIDYAMKHQTGLNQSRINIAVAHTTNLINLSGWLPQLNVSGEMLHYNNLPTSLVPNDSLASTARTSARNIFAPGASVSETIFNPQLLYAAKASRLYVQQAEQIRDSTSIYIYANVSKAFYNLLLTLEQITVLKEDTARLDRNVMDTYHQFEGGIVDETDYDEAVITLNNSLAQLQQQMQNITPQYAVLKELMGYPPEKQFNVSFDTVQMISDIAFDTTQQLDYKNRIEYQQIQTAEKIQHQVTGYYGLAWLPSLSAFYNYYHEFENNSASDLFNTAYPYSYLGLQFNIPIFTGLNHIENVHKSRLQEQIISLAADDLKSNIYTQYTTALANYKGNLFNWKTQKDNMDKAKNVYRIVSLQYKQGIVAYLNMIVAESNLISAEIGYTNALFQLLSSKIDLEKSMGTIPAYR